MKYLKTREAVSATGLHGHTLRRYADNGIIPSVKTPAGQRLYDVEAWINNKKQAKATICYCRVSSVKQKDDLERQVEFVKKAYPEAEIIRDIGSGLNFKRKGLRTILGRILQGEQLTLVVAHRDRLARFGYELIEYLLQQHGGQLVVLDRTSKKSSPVQELTQDLLSIMGVFSARMHGLRKYREQIQQDSDIPKETDQTDIQTMDGYEPENV